ncbi:kinase-like domain-containing protein [Schizophyllum fasciatum]
MTTPSIAAPFTFLPCPPLRRSSSALSQTIFGYLHVWLLKPLSYIYARLLRLSREKNIYPLPFNLILKSHKHLREEEGLAMDLARAMGVPAPRFLSFGVYGNSHSLLMTKLPGRVLDQVEDGQVDWALIKADLQTILRRLRAYASPFGPRICGVAGGPVRGPMIPNGELPAFDDERAFQKALRRCFRVANEHDAGTAVTAHRFFALPEHAVVFSHGDLKRHNVMVGDDGHISGIFDWEAAGWLPEYWEVSVTAVVPEDRWGRLMEEISGNVYENEVEGHRAVFLLVEDSLRE